MNREEKALECTRNWKVTTKVNERALLVCDEDKKTRQGANVSGEKRNCQS